MNTNILLSLILLTVIGAGAGAVSFDTNWNIMKISIRIDHILEFSTIIKHCFNTSIYFVLQILRQFP